MPDRQGAEPMYDDDPTDSAHSPIDDQGRTPVGGEEGKGWLYLPFERDDATVKDAAHEGCNRSWRYAL